MEVSGPSPLAKEKTDGGENSMFHDRALRGGYTVKFFFQGIS